MRNYSPDNPVPFPNGVVIGQPLDWFTFETHIRRLVVEMIEQPIKLSYVQDEEISKIQELQKKMQVKLDEIEFIA